MIRFPQQAFKDSVKAMNAILSKQFSLPKRALSMSIQNSITSLIGGAILAAGLGAASGQDTPGVRIGRGDIVSPDDARTYYGGVANPSITPVEMGGGQPIIPAVIPEIDALAASLKDDPALIFEYVHDKVEFEPLYGLQKGALGTLIDKSGNAFDQAQLLVQLLRAAGYSANYAMGDVTLSAADFSNLFAVDNAGVACHVLADGGIPSDIAAGACPSASTPIPSSVKISHVWVEATIGGSTVKYDPSLKSHHIVNPLLASVSTSMGYTPGSILTTVGNGQTSSTNAIRNLNSSAVETALTSMSTTLANVLNQPAYYDKSLDELLGAELIVPLRERQLVGYPGVDSRYVRDGNPVAEIPNAYRTLVDLDFYIRDDADYTDDAAQNFRFYADQIYGRRLAVDWTTSHSIVPDQLRAYLSLDDKVVGQINTHEQNNNGHEETLKMAHGNATTVRFKVNHAYASNGGSYMDREYLKGFGSFSQPATFIFGFGGRTSDALQQKLANLHYRDLRKDVTTSCFSGGVLNDGSNASIAEVTLTEGVKTQVGYGWLAQFSRATDLQARAVDAIAQQHHSFGLAYTSAGWRNLCEAASAAAPGLWFVAEFAFNFDATFGTPQVYPNRNLFAMFDSAVQLDILSGISVNQRDGDENSRKATGQAIALAGATLEGSVFEQYMNLVDTASTAERFEWFNQNAASNQYFRVLNDADDTDTTNASFNYTTLSGEVLSGHAWYKQYTEDGYLIIAPEGNQLGPGAFGIVPGTESDIGQSVERGAAFIAVKTDGSEVAHIVFTGYNTSKGGGASTENTERFDASKVADVLRDQFKDRSQLHGVDLSSGQVSYSPPADLTTGSGAFPYSLSFQRSYSTAGGRSRGMGVGWSHNWDINASTSGSGTEAMGATRAARAVPSLVAFIVAQDAYNRNGAYTKGTDTLRRFLTANFVGHWWREQLQHNVVSIQMGTSGIQFFRMPDGSFDAPTGSAAKLEHVGAGRRTTEWARNCSGGPNNIRFTQNQCSRRYDYASVKYRYTDADGNTLLFDRAKDALAPLNPNAPQFFPSEWAFASGVTLNFTHNSEAQLTSVTSNIGGAQNGPALQLGWNGPGLQSVTGTGLGTVHFAGAAPGDREGSNPQPSIFEEPRQKNTPVLASVTALDGTVTSYDYVGMGINTSAYNDATAIVDWMPRLYSVTTPEDPSQPKMRFKYDDLWNASGLEDEVHIKAGSGTRGEWAFNIVPGHRGERIDPLGQSYTVEYDAYGLEDDPLTIGVIEQDYGRVTRTIDEATRTYIGLQDGIGRVVRRVMPEGNVTEFDYDQYSNLIETRRYAKTGGTPQRATAVYGDANWPKKPTAVYDFNQMSLPANQRQATGIIYHATTGLPVQATFPADADGIIGTNSFAYNGVGQMVRVTDAEGLVTVNDYMGGNMVATVVNCGVATATDTSQCLAADNDNHRPKTVYTYNVVGDVISVNGPKDPAVTDVESPLFISDQIDDITSTLYDAMRRPVQVTDPYGTTTITTYDAISRPTLVASYDVGGNVLQSASTAYTVGGLPCSASGAACAQFSPDGAVTTTTYDALDRVDIVTDPDGRQAKTVYDPLGRPRIVYQGFGSAQEIKYQQYDYTLNGQVRYVADANGNKTSYFYDGFDRLEQTCFPSATKPAAGTIGTSNCADDELYRYDDNGNMVGKRTRAEDWIFNAYDALNRMTGKTVYQGGTWSGSAVTGGTVENAISYTYDLVGRDLEIEQDGGTTVAGTTVPDYTLSYLYDDLGRPLEERQKSGLATSTAVERIVRRKFDVAGNRRELRYPVGTLRINYQYDALSRLDKITFWQQQNEKADYDYDALSRRTELTYTNLGLDQMGAYYGYFADSALRLMTHNFIGTDDATFDYQYTRSNQLTSIKTSHPEYMYDSARPDIPPQQDYVANGLNQYETVTETSTTTSLTYDLNGNLTGDGTWTYSYDVENRLVKAVGQGKTITHEYGPKGRRVATHSSVAGRTEYMYEGDEPIADYDGNDNLLRQYVNGAGIDERLLYIQYDANGDEELRQYYHANHQGTIIAMSNGGQLTPAKKYTYDSYGVPGEPEDGQPFRYTGRRWDSETGLYYYRARYYSAKLGRFLQTDPIGYEDNMNMYGYTNNDPVNGTDPRGLCAYDACVVEGTVVLGTGVVYTVAAVLVATGICVEFCGDVMDGIEDFVDGILNNDSSEPTGTLPDEIYDKKAPDQRPPAGGETIEQGRFNPATGEYEESTVEYDEYGRQKRRVDKTDHGRPDSHDNPHEHEREYGPGYGPKGKETRSPKKKEPPKEENE